jgi:hypothetical protein
MMMLQVFHLRRLLTINYFVVTRTGADLTLKPTLLRALNETLYESRCFSPLTMFVTGRFTQVIPPFSEYWYLVTGPAAGSVGGASTTENPALTPMMLVITGFAGTPIGVEVTTLDPIDVPDALVACTITLYKVPLVSPLIAQLGAPVVLQALVRVLSPTAWDAVTV